MGKGHKKRSKTRCPEQLAVAARYVIQWASLPSSEDPSSSASQNELGDWLSGLIEAKQLTANFPVTDFHTHSSCSDGMLSPVELVEKAHLNRVQVLALTDHDTMMGVPAALEAAHRHGIRLIPGVEISAKYRGRMQSRVEEPVHILAYYSCCGPSNSQELDDCLARIREGRYCRARAIIDKLRTLKKPIKLEQVLAIAGTGVAPGRVHVARAMIEAGHVENMREAFNKYLYDGGPAYATGYELDAEEAVRLVCNTGGVSALAHPWALKDPLSVIKRLKAAGLHAIEVYRGDGKVTAFAALADTYQLVKLGGSDFHGRGDSDEIGLGKVALPILAVHEFLKVAEPIWCTAVRDMLQVFAKENFETRFGEVDAKTLMCRSQIFNGDISLGFFEDDVGSAFLRLSPWMTEEEKLVVKEVVSQLKLSHKVVLEGGHEILVVGQ